MMNNDHHQHLHQQQQQQQQHYQQQQQRHHLLTSNFGSITGISGGGMAADAAAAAAMSSANVFGDDDIADNDSSNGGGGGPDDDEEAEGVWAPDIEQAFQEAIQLYLPCGRRKIILQDEGKMYGRNELIARYIKLRVGKTRTRKQVSSHIQVLARKRTRELHSKIKDPSQRDKALHQLATMSSAQIVSAPFFAAAAAAAAQNGGSLPPGMMMSSHQQHGPHHHSHSHNVAFAAMQQHSHPQHAAHLWPTNQAAAAAAAAAQHHHHHQHHTQQQQQHNNAQNQHHHQQAAAAAAAVAAAAAAHQLSSSCNNNNSQNSSAFGSNVVAAGGSGTSAQWETRFIASQRLRMTQFWAYLEYVAVKKVGSAALPAAAEATAVSPTTSSSLADASSNNLNVASRHTFLHIGSGSSSSSNKCDNNNTNNNNNGEPTLETIDIKEVYDKFPDKKGGLKDLYEKGPSQAFFLVKCWANLNFGNMLATASANNDATFFGHNTEFESSEQMEITCSTQLCSSGKLVVEKVENECARLENDRFVYRFNRSPMCEYMINFITKLKQLADQSTMNSVLENFTVLQVVTNRTTSETLLCIAYVFEVLSVDEHEPQHNVYRLADDENEKTTTLLYNTGAGGGATNNVDGIYSH